MAACGEKQMAIEIRTLHRCRSKLRESFLLLRMYREPLHCPAGRRNPETAQLNAPSRVAALEIIVRESAGA